MKPTYETPSAHKRERFENFRRKKPPIYEPGIAAKPDVQPQLLVVLGLGRVVYDAYARSDETTDRAHGAISKLIRGPKYSSSFLFSVLP